MKALISTLLLTSIGLFVASASLAEVYKVTTSNSAKVFVTAQTANTEIHALVNNEPKMRRVAYNGCGWTKFKESVSAPVVAYSYLGSSLAIAPGAEPVCTKNAQGVFIITNDGSVGEVRRTSSGYIYHKAFEANIGFGQENVFITTQSTKKAKVNACGFASFVIKSLSATPTASFSIDGTSYALSGLPARTYPDVCRKVGTAYLLFTPVAGN